MRMISKDVCITRPSPSNGLYKMSNHSKSERNPLRESLLFSSVKRMYQDGLSNLDMLKTKVVNVREYSLFTHFLIEVGERDPNYFERFHSKLSRAEYFTHIGNFFNLK